MPALGNPCKRQTADQGRDERGTGLVGTLFGVTAFLLFVLFASQVLIGLYTTTVVSSAVTEAANELSHQVDPTSSAAQQMVTETAMDRLGSYARGHGRVALDWSATDGDTVVVTVHARKPTLLPPAFGAALGDRIDRTLRVRVERVR